jgi:hypothetical protein
MIMSPPGLGTKNDCFGEDQKQFTLLDSGVAKSENKGYHVLKVYLADLITFTHSFQSGRLVY